MSANKKNGTIEKTLTGEGSVKISFKMAANIQNDKNRHISTTFKDENDNVLLTLDVLGAHSNDGKNGLRYSLSEDRMTDDTDLETFPLIKGWSSISYDYHTVEIIFDMTQHKVTLTVDGTKELDGVEMTNSEGTNVSKMTYHEVSWGALSSLLIDDFGIAEYTAE